MKRLDYYLEKVSKEDLKKPLIYFDNGETYEYETKRDVSNEFIRINTLKYISEKFYVDDLCIYFNNINFLNNKKDYLEVENLDNDGIDSALGLIKAYKTKYPESYQRSDIIEEYDKSLHNIPIDRDYGFSAEGYILINELLIRNYGSQFDFEELLTVYNTYNFETFLDRVVQVIGSFVLDNNREYCLIQIHDGGDVRGNYFSHLLVRYNGDCPVGLIIDDFTNQDRIELECTNLEGEEGTQLIYGSEYISLYYNDNDERRKFLSDKYHKIIGICVE